MDTFKRILGFSQPKTFAQQVSEKALKVVEAAPEVLEGNARICSRKSWHSRF